MEAKNFIECKFDLGNPNDAALWQQIQQLPTTLKRLEELEKEVKELKGVQELNSQVLQVPCNESK